MRRFDVRRTCDIDLSEQEIVYILHTFEACCALCLECLFKEESRSGLARLSARSDRRVSVHGGWLCFANSCMSLDV